MAKKPTTKPSNSAPDDADTMADPAADQAATPPAEANGSPDAPGQPADPAPTASDADAAPPAGADDGDEPLSIDVILRNVAAMPRNRSRGYVRLSPTPVLTGEQAELQYDLADALAARGVSLRDQGQVYAWILDQVAVAVGRA
jgi:hypothetical protein